MGRCRLRVTEEAGAAWMTLPVTVATAEVAAVLTLEAALLTVCAAVPRGPAAVCADAALDPAESTNRPMAAVRTRRPMSRFNLIPLSNWRPTCPEHFPEALHSYGVRRPSCPGAAPPRRLTRSRLLEPR